MRLRTQKFVVGYKVKALMKARPENTSRISNTLCLVSSLVAGLYLMEGQEK
jgi:hypothetical protein